MLPFGERTDEMMTAKEKAQELQRRLVDCCVKFIEETGDIDIDMVTFRADSLQESAQFGSWHPATDSYIGIYGIDEDEDGGKLYGLRAESM